MPVADTLEDLARLLKEPDSGIVHDLPSLIATIAEGGTVFSKVPTEAAFGFVQGVQFGTAGFAAASFNALVPYLNDAEQGEIFALFGISPKLQHSDIRGAICDSGRCYLTTDLHWHCIFGPGHCWPEVQKP